MNQNIVGSFLLILNAITFSDHHRLQLSQYLPYSLKFSGQNHLIQNIKAYENSKD